MKHLLTIAGFDPCGGAGIQADLKTFHDTGNYGLSVTTALTVQNTKKVYDTQVIESQFVYNQLIALKEDVRIDGIKIGMLGNSDIAKTVIRFLDEDWETKPRVIIDPVMISSSGFKLLDDEGIELLIKELFKRAFLITPNLDEAEFILERKIVDLEDAKKAVLMFKDMGIDNVLLKGGHLDGAPTDILMYDSEIHVFEGRRIKKTSTHGTGCTLSSAITSYLASGMSLPEAVEKSKQYVAKGIETGIEIGNGKNPLNHFQNYRRA